MAKAVKQWRVVSNNPGQRLREHFAGNEDDARTYVQNHFPAAHVEPPSQDPGVPDVVLVSPTGQKEHYHKHVGWQSGDGIPTVESEDDDTVTDDDDD